MTEAEAREAGFELEDYDTEELEIWPENVQAVQMFCRIGTRWVHASGGMGAVITGVRWEAMYPLIDRLNLPPGDWEDLLGALEVMEQAALPVIRAAAAGKHK
ncbi:MAG: DUF1799 domain-containing protein [Acidovorax sp.]|nr:DUF1799 domain-containing protein [Acidovorax sp.]MDH4425066.1 DUF1799 domain-containing protein [Acidovorax sp.]